MKQSGDVKSIIKTVVYALLIVGCVALFVLFGSKRSEFSYEPKSGKTAKQEDDSAKPAACNALVEALSKSGMPCGFSGPSVNPDGTIAYKLLLENEIGEGAVIIKPNKDFLAVRSELRLNYPYTETLSEEESDEASAGEYERRENIHKSLIKNYIKTVTAALDYTDSVNTADLLTAADAVITSYLKLKPYNKTFGNLRFTTFTDCENAYRTFYFVITLSIKS